MQDRGVEDKVITSTFHSWCKSSSSFKGESVARGQLGGGWVNSGHFTHPHPSSPLEGEGAVRVAHSRINRAKSNSAWYAASVQAVLDAAERGLIPGGQYDAVLIDEAHDFEPQWLALAAKMVNPDNNALMIV